MTVIPELTVATAASARSAATLLSWPCFDAGLPRPGSTVGGGDSFETDVRPYDHGQSCLWDERTRVEAHVRLTAPADGRLQELRERAVSAIAAAGGKVRAEIHGQRPPGYGQVAAVVTGEWKRPA